MIKAVGKPHPSNMFTNPSRVPSDQPEYCRMVSP